MHKLSLFEKNIAQLSFNLRSRADEGGVLLTANYLQNASDLSPQEIFALEIAKDKFAADAVYFRYFSDGRGAVPQIYIYDNTREHLNEDSKRSIHIKVWSGCQVPMFIIINKAEVHVFDAREKASQDTAHFAFETIQLTANALSAFSAKSFDNGLFWEEENNKGHFQFQTSAYRDLIAGLKAVYADFQKNSGLNSHVSLKLLVQCLLIKYLEERDQQSESGYFSKTYFKKHFSCTDFCDVIRAGKLLELLDKLSADFNGRIFEWDVEQEKKERKAIAQSKIKKLADYLDGNVQNQQFVLWRLYSFSHLPVELISSVYEELLTNSKDIVYTPEMIVSTLVDECMPLKGPRKSFKVIDVSCGSGIFLVKAYKRLIQWWRYENWQKNGVLAKPSLAELKQLLINNIYGIDIEEDAIRLTVFSLALALLDEVNLDPPTWQRLKFPDLNESNIVTADFFAFISGKYSKDFDLVIGNPPFNPAKALHISQTANAGFFANVATKYGYKSEIKIPDDNPALHFLVQAMKLLKKDAVLCLIQPAGPLLYQKEPLFKEQLFSKYNLLQVLDFTKLADVLWGNKTVATAAIFLQNCPPTSENVIHVVVNRAFSNINRLFIEIDHYDFHALTKESAKSDPYVWKSNLLGGGRLFGLINRMEKMPTLGDYLKEKVKNNDWVFGDGFIKGKADNLLVESDFEKKKGGYSKAPYLTGSDSFLPEDFDENGIAKVYKLKDKYFQWKRQPDLFKAPLVLIKKNIGVTSIPVVLSEKPISFKNEIVGIHAPKKDLLLLKSIKDTIVNNQFFRVYLSLTSARAGISRSNSTLLQEDILRLPYSEGKEAIRFSAVEKMLVNDVLNFQLKANEKKLQIDASVKEVTAFGSVYCQTLNSVYKEGSKAFSLFKILDAGKYYALHFEYSRIQGKATCEAVDSLIKYIEKIIPTAKASNSNMHTQRILKIFGKDTIVLAKPKKLKYWLSSIALRDADETFDDYIKARYL